MLPVFAVIATTASLRGEDNAELSVLAVATKGAMPATPELEAVALVPVTLWVAAVGSLLRCRHSDPGLGKELLAVPFSFLQIELPKPGNVLGSDIKTISADRNPLWALLPNWFADSQRFKQPGREVFKNGLPGHLLNDRGEHVRCRSVVAEVRPRLMRNGMGQKRFRPMRRLAPVDFILMPRVHCQQVSHPHRFQIVGRFRRRVIGERTSEPGHRGSASPRSRQTPPPLT